MRRGLLAPVLVALGGAVAAAPLPARADQSQPAPVSANPVDGGDVRTLGYAQGWLYAGGSFTGVNRRARAALARLNPVTGAVDPGLDLGIAAPHSGVTKVDDLSVSPDGSRLVAIGAIESA